jgi:4-alpha-glucanotransferase
MLSEQQDASFLTAPHWARIGIRHHHGICTPLSALVTSESAGIGEYLDLIPLIEWLPKTGFDILQLLPINDTGADPSPYMGLSAHALHPIYLSLRALPEANRVPGFLSAVETLAKLSATPRVQYRDVLQGKLRLLSTYLDHCLPSLQHDPEFERFCDEQTSWLTPYSIFKALKKLQGGRAWWDWDPSIKVSPSMEAGLSEEVVRWRAIQYLCFSQFSQVRAAADARGVLLMGDVPILINKDSVDVWRHPELFVLKKDVGAPPDMYNKEGQHWGFPLYHWSAHRKTGFTWWKERLRLQERLYHLYRLDHLVGFFRLYAITPGKKASSGTFVPHAPEEWEQLGRELLTMMVGATTMLPLGEDLGDVPDLVRRSMHDLGVPGLKVLRWERRWHTDGSFVPPATFSPESVTTVSTHDSSTVRGWWTEDPLVAKRAAHDYGLTWNPVCTPSLLSDILSVSHRSGSLFHINLLNEYLSLFPELSWNDPELERINRPGTLDPLNWSYRTKVPLSSIVNHPGLAIAMRALGS